MPSNWNLLLDFLYSHAMKPFETISKTRLSALRKLTQKKYRIESKKFLVEGLRSVEEAIASPWNIETVLMTPEFISAASHQNILQQMREKKISTYSISSKELNKITDTVHAQGIVAVVQQTLQSQANPDKLQSYNIIVAVDEIAEPGNLGTIIRTCDWFGVDAMLMSKNSVELFNPKVVRATVGSIFHIPIVAEVDMPSVLQKLRTKGFHIYTTVIEGGVDVTKVSWREKAVFVFGNEARGISADIVQLADTKIRIPRIGKAESLNVGIACGIVLASFRFHLSAKS